MSILIAEQTAGRIRVATSGSPIVVLKTQKRDGESRKFESWFADTDHGYRYLKRPCKRYLGSYYGEDDAEKFLQDCA